MTDTSLIDRYADIADCTVVETVCRDGLTLRGLEVMPTKPKASNPYGNPEKNMVVILHGIAFPPSMLEEVVHTLVLYALELQAKVVCFNYRGYGYSDHPYYVKGA